MPNSKTEHSKNLRNKTSAERTKRLIQEGKLKKFNVFVYDNYIDKMEALKISKTEFLRKAFDLLDEKGNISEKI